MSSGGSSSSSDDEDDAGADGAAAEPDAAAKQRALEEARAMLADRPRSKKKRSNAWFEEEVARLPASCVTHMAGQQQSDTENILRALLPEMP